jgi:hypothetical protein
MQDDPSYRALKPVDIEAIACEERRLVSELQTLGFETSLEKVGEQTREWFGKVSELLLAHSNGQQAISPALARSLWFIISRLSVGKVHSAIENAAAGAGRRQETPLQRLDKQAAVNFVAQVKAGLISVSDPIGEVAKAYHVTKRTVQNWVHDILPDPNVLDDPPAFIIRRASIGASRYRSGKGSVAPIGSQQAKREARKFRSSTAAGSSKAARK